MERADHDRFTAELTAWAARCDDVVGLVAVGSTAARSRGPDRWSDHDLAVVAADGAGDRVRADPSWLPDADRIVLRFTEPDHGLTVVYDDGHLIEFAVCEAGELGWLAMPERRVLVGGVTVEARLPPVVSTREAHDPVGADRFHRFVKELVIGAARLRRGERASSRQRVATATALLFDLATDVLPAARPELLDPLDASRRVEQALPTLAAALDDCLEGTTEAAIAGLVEVAERFLVGAVPAARREPLDAVRAVLDPPPRA